MWWWAAGLVCKEDRYHGNQGQVLNSGSEFLGTALTMCGRQIWKLPSLPEPCMSPGFHEQWGRDLFMVISKRSLGSSCGITVWWFGAWEIRKYHFCTVSVLYCFYSWTVLSFLRPIESTSQINTHSMSSACVGEVMFSIHKQNLILKRMV